MSAPQLTTLIMLLIVDLTLIGLHRIMPPGFCIDSRLRRLPSTPNILDRVLTTGRRQILWGGIGGLCGLAAGVAIWLIGRSNAPDPSWQPVLSWLIFDLLGMIVGSALCLLRHGYAFAGAGVRVTHSSAPALRRVVGTPALVLCHVCLLVVIALAVAVSVAAVDSSRKAAGRDLFGVLGEVWILSGLTVVFLIIANLAGPRILRIPTAATSPQELIWDASLKATGVQSNYSNAMVAAFFTPLTVLTHLQVQLHTVHFMLGVAGLVLAGVACYLTVRSRPNDLALGMPVVRPTDRPVHH